MTKFQAQHILINQLYIDAVLEYRRDPIGVSGTTFRRAELWIEAEHLASQG